MFNVANPQLNLQFKPTWILSCRFMDLCATLALCVFFFFIGAKTLDFVLCNA